MTQAYPLAWPQGWPRTDWRKRQRANFSTQRGIRAPSAEGKYEAKPKPVTLAVAVQRLDYQLHALGAKLPVLSTDIELRMDGKPRADRRDPGDPGAACYFQLNGRPTVLACDRWQRVADNVAAIAQHIDALRRMDRYGVGSMERLFEGFAALPPPNHVDWRATLGIPAAETVTAELVQLRRRQLGMLHHPDHGGSVDNMARINAAADAALKELQAGWNMSS